jgi:hypothetical protein
MLMADLINDLASKAGVSPEQAQQGLGAVLGFLKSHLPADAYARVSAAVPEGASAAAAAPPAEEPGGLLSGLAGAVGKLFGGGGAAQELVAKLTHLGFSAEQLQAFLPRVMESLRGKLPEDVMRKLSGLLPAPQESAR